MKPLLALAILLAAPAALVAAANARGDDTAEQDTAEQDTGKGGAQSGAAPVETGAAERDAAVIRAQKPAYPLETCAVSGEPLGAMVDPVDVVVEGRLYRLCCSACETELRADPAPFEAKVIEAVIADQGPRYPLKTCLVSSEPLEGEHEGQPVQPVDRVFGTRLVRFCCGGCVQGYEAAPEAFLSELDRAWMDAQRPSYPLEVCVISGEPLARPREVLYGVTLVRLCCKKCERTFAEGPEPFLAVLEAARAKPPARAGAGG